MRRRHAVCVQCACSVRAVRVQCAWCMGSVRTVSASSGQYGLPTKRARSSLTRGEASAARTSTATRKLSLIERDALRP